MILGIHCSIRGGHLAALDEARGLGCGGMQMFSYRRRREPDPEELEAFRRARAGSTVGRLLVHVRYLPFLASPDAERRLHSVRLLERELRLARALEAEGLVVHAGAHSIGDDAARGLSRFASGVAEAWSRAAAQAIPADSPSGSPPAPPSPPSGAMVRGDIDGSPQGFHLLVENVPGGDRRMGGPLEQLADLGERLAACGVPVGFCLDTAHAWAQGYDISSTEGMWRFLGRANRLLGSARIRAFHLNDTRALLGSHRESHWHWGRGYLGTEGLEFLLARDEFQDRVGILETPKEGDAGNLALARSLASRSVRPS